MRRSALVVAALALGSSVLALPRADASLPGGEWRGEPTWIGGTSRYDRGEWIHTDFVVDDFGADTGPAWGQPNVVSLAPTAGDARYPRGDAYRDNAADIVEVRIRAHRDDLQVRVLLSTLVDPEVVALWVDVDGAEHVVTVRSADLGVQIDADANTVTFTVPGAASGDEVSLNVGAGLHDGQGGMRAGVPGNRSTSPDEITTGGPTQNRLFDLAFNTHELEGRGGAWNEDRQSAALAAGDVAPFAQTIDLARLRDRRARAAEPVPPGYHVRILESRMDLGEGIGGSFPQYRSRWQPYAVWVPAGHDPATPGPLFLNLHSLSSHHNQYRGGTSPTYGTFYEQTGDELGAIVVTPLGRGPDGWYLDEALVDVLEVWADVARNHPIDPERVAVGGYSMGGYGTYRLTTLVPDAFAAAVSVVGPPTNGIWTGLDMPSSPTFTYPQLESTRHVPFWITHGVLDELVPVYGVARQAERFAELGHEHRFALHPAEDHLTFTVKDDWAREAAWLAEHDVRVTDPHRVTHRVRPASWLRDDRSHLAPLMGQLLAEVGARLDGAYWVGDVVVDRQDAQDVTGVVDLTSSGIARQRTGASSVLDAGIDGPSPYRLTGAAVSWRDDGPTEDVLSGRLEHVASLTVDLGRAGLSDAPTLRVHTDRPVTLTFVRDGAVVGSRTVAPTTLLHVPGFVG